MRLTAPEKATPAATVDRAPANREPANLPAVLPAEPPAELTPDLRTEPRAELPRRPTAPAQGRARWTVPVPA